MRDSGCEAIITALKTLPRPLKVGFSRTTRMPYSSSSSQPIAGGGGAAGGGLSAKASSLASKARALRKKANDLAREEERARGDGGPLTTVVFAPGPIGMQLSRRVGDTSASLERFKKTPSGYDGPAKRRSVPFFFCFFSRSFVLCCCSFPFVWNEGLSINPSYPRTFEHLPTHTHARTHARTHAASSCPKVCY